MISSWISTVYTIDHREEGSSDFDALYDKPWTRISPYLIGLICGVFIFNLQTKYRNIQKTTKTLFFVIIGWILAICLNISVVYGVYHADLGLTTALGKVNTTLNRAAWTIGLAWMTLSCISGFGGPINWILCLPPLKPLSRLTYTAYLIHPVIILFNYQNMETPTHGSLITMAWFYVANLCLSYGTAFLYSIVFEAPYINLQKLFQI